MAKKSKGVRAANLAAADDFILNERLTTFLIDLSVDTVMRAEFNSTDERRATLMRLYGLDSAAVMALTDRSAAQVRLALGYSQWIRK